VGSTLDARPVRGDLDATENPMKAVLIEVDVTGVDGAHGVAALRERIVPAISVLPGLLFGTWLTGASASHADSC
jgi:hypothetical protein